MSRPRHPNTVMDIGQEAIPGEGAPGKSVQHTITTIDEGGVVASSVSNAAKPPISGHAKSASRDGIPGETEASKTSQGRPKPAHSHTKSVSISEPPKILKIDGFVPGSSSDLKIGIAQATHGKATQSNRHLRNESSATAPKLTSAQHSSVSVATDGLAPTSIFGRFSRQTSASSVSKRSSILSRVSSMIFRPPPETISVPFPTPEENIRTIKKANYVRTTKYTLFTFLPLNLFSQFQRFYNLYFLAGALSTLSGDTSLSAYTQITPLVVVLCATAIKDAWEDYVRFIFIINLVCDGV